MLSQPRRWRASPARRKRKRSCATPARLTEASYHAPFDHCTAKYLTQAGVKNTFVRLGDVGIHGNGHVVMLEKNSSQVAAFLLRWIAVKVK